MRAPSTRCRAASQYARESYPSGSAEAIAIDASSARTKTATPMAQTSWDLIVVLVVAGVRGLRLESGTRDEIDAPVGPIAVGLRA